MFETKVIDDLFTPEEIETIRLDAMAAPWRFLHDVTGVVDQPYPSYGFTYVMRNDLLQIKNSFYEGLAVPIANKVIDREGLKISNIPHARIFLQLPPNEAFRKAFNGVHVDLAEPHIVLLYYVNDTEGPTFIYENTVETKDEPLKLHQRVNPKAGRVVLFDGARYHASSQPFTKYRCIINMDLV